MNNTSFFYIHGIWLAVLVLLFMMLVFLYSRWNNSSTPQLGIFYKGKGILVQEKVNDITELILLCKQHSLVPEEGEYDIVDQKDVRINDVNKLKQLLYIVERKRTALPR